MRVLITAGPTREPIDAVRYIGNRSSGRMGFALAEAAAEAGDQVTLLLGPVPLPPALAQHQKVRAHRFGSTADLKRLLEAHVDNGDLLLMAAAVADYTPTQVRQGKLKREEDAAGRLTIELEPTPDLIRAVAQWKRADQTVVAFALEEAEHLAERAAEKMRRKGVDAIVANPLGTMESERITGLWLTAGGVREAPPAMSKQDFARWLLSRARSLAAASGSGAEG